MLEGWRRAGAYIRTARTRAGYSAQEFADAAGISERTLWALEMGERDNFSPDTLDRVEGELDLPPGEIEHLAGGGRPRRSTYPPDLQEVIRSWRRLTPNERAMIVQVIRAARQPRRDV